MASDADRARVGDLLSGHLLSVGVAEALDADGHDLALVLRLAAQRLEPVAPLLVHPITLRRLLDQGDRQLEHSVERVDADTLVGLMVALRSIGQIRAGKSGSLERVRIGGTAGHNVRWFVSARPQGTLAENHLLGPRSRAVALEHPLHGHVEITLLGIRRVLEMVDHLRGQNLGLGFVEATHLRLQATAFRHDVDCAAALDRAHVRSRLGVETTEPHRGDGPRRGRDRAASSLGAQTGVGRATVELGGDAMVRGRRQDYLADRRGVIEDVAERTAQPTDVELARASQ